MTRQVRFVNPSHEDVSALNIQQLLPGSAEWVPIETHIFVPYPWKVYQAVVEDFPPGTELRASVGYASSPLMSDWSEPLLYVPEPSAASVLLAGALLLSLLTHRRKHQHARTHR